MVDIGTQADFYAWLNARYHKRVGFPRRTGSCPLANWLRSVNHRRDIHVSVFVRLGIHNPRAVAWPCPPVAWPCPPVAWPCPPVELPGWAADYLENVDTLAEPGAMDGEYALQFLMGDDA